MKERGEAATVSGASVPGTTGNDMTTAVGVVFELAIALADATTTEDVVGTAVSRCTAAFGACGAVIATLTADGAQVEILRALGMPDEIEREWRTFPITAPVPIAYVARTGEPEFIESRAHWATLYPQIGPLLEETGHHAIAALPLAVAGRRVGVMGLSFDTPRAFTHDERVLSLAVASLVAQALDRAKLYQDERAARAAAEVALACAEEANRAKANFLAVMSHELRTPLNAIGGYAQLIGLGIRGPVTEAQLADLARIRRSTEHLLGLVNDVLSFVRLDTGRVSFDIGDTALASICEQVAEIVGAQLHARRLRFEYSVDDGDVHVSADPERLRQILINLLVNAGKFTEEGGRVTLACETVDDRVHIHVSDTGCGIPADLLGRIFEPFVQVGRQLDKPVDGVGLGLAISRDLARGMGGDLTVTSEPGKGSCFTLTVPRWAARG